MSFASPAWLLLNLLGVFVALLHMRRRTVVEVSSVELWQRLVPSAEVGASRRRLNPNLPLLLQLLAVLLTSVGLAAPYFGAAPSRTDHLFVVLDVSSSMSTRDQDGTRFSSALAWLQDEFERLENQAGGATAHVSILTVGPQVDVVRARLESLDSARRTLSELELSDGGARWRAVAPLLRELVTDGESARVVILTDAAGSGAARAAVPAGFDPEVHPFGAGADNVAFARARVTQLGPETGRWRVEGTVRAYTRKAPPPELTVWFTPSATEGALLWADQALEYEDGVAAIDFELELPSAGLLELRLPEDALATDSVARFVLKETPRTVRILHVGPNNPPLRRALRAAGKVTLTRAESLPEASSTFDLVVVDRVLVSRHPGTHTLWVGGAALNNQTPTPLSTSRPTGWQSDGPLSRSVDWAGVLPGPSFRVPKMAGAKVLLTSSSDPLVQARTTGAGREIVLAFDLRSSPWVNELGFPVFISNVVHWVAPWEGQVVGPTCVIGVACTLDPRDLFGGLTLQPTSAETPPITLPSPFVVPESRSPRAQAWAPPGFSELFWPKRAGTYQVGESGEIIVVAALATEADVRAAARSSPTPSPPHQPFSRAFLLTAAIILIAETWVAGRGSDGFLKRSGWHRGNLLAGRYRTVLGLRALALLLLVLALFGVPGLIPLRERDHVIVVDDARLYAGKVAERFEAVVARLGTARGSRATPTIHLGDDPKLTLGLGTEDIFKPSAGQGAPHANLASALDVSLGLLGAGDSGRITVVANGAQTEDEVARLLPALANRGATIDVVPVGGVPEGEVLLESLSLPAQLRQGDSFSLHGVIYSSVATSARLRLWRDREPRAWRNLRLAPGFNKVKTVLSEETAGRYLYEYEVDAAPDVFVQNNRDGVVADVSPKAKVALVTPQPDVGNVLASALTSQDLSVEVMAPADVPYSLSDMLHYDTVILANVPAIDLHSEQQELLERWVRDYGGGLLILGGENSFGPGGYYQTPLERISPLSSRVPRDAPRVAMLFVLDRSGSMQQTSEGVSRLEIAKQATLEATRLLHPESLVGIVVFDSAATALLPLQRAAGGRAVQQSLEGLQPGGGTSIYPALVRAYEQMRAVGATTRHIVVMTDGLSEPGDFDSILSDIVGDKITVSTVAVGQGADTRLLQSVAEQGRGAFHATTDFRALPSILSQEALMLSSTPVEEGAFTPVWQDREAAFLSELPNRLPPLYGYVRTTGKRTASIHLLGPEDDPILASWQYGLGRVVAFASQGAGLWARAWQENPAYPLVWAQASQWTLPPVAPPGFQIDFGRVGDEVNIQIEAIGEEGEPAQDIRPRAFWQPEEGSPRPLNLVETRPGGYHATVAPQQGRFQVRVENRDGDVEAAKIGSSETALPQAEADYYFGPPARYAFNTQGVERLQGLAAATGGRVLLGDEPLPSGGARLRWHLVNARPLWASLALLVFMLELTLRYAARLSLFRWRPLRAGRMVQKPNH